MYLFWIHTQDLFPSNFSLKKHVGEGRFLEMERSWEVAVSKSKGAAASKSQDVAQSSKDDGKDSQ